MVVYTGRMSRVGESVTWVANNPVEAIMVMIAVTLFLFGLYVFSPFYVVQNNAAIAQAFGANIGQRALIGLGFYVLPTLPVIASIFSPRFRTCTWYARGCFGMFIGLCFLSALRIIVIGITPLQWVFSLALGLTLGICYLYWRAKE